VRQAASVGKSLAIYFRSGRNPAELPTGEVSSTEIGKRMSQISGT
jgi:hypothetical protein